MDEKVKKVKGLLKDCRENFIMAVRYHDLEKVDEKTKGEHFDKNLNLIARDLATDCYKDTEADDIDEIEFIDTLEEWLENVKKFKIVGEVTTPQNPAKTTPKQEQSKQNTPSSQQQLDQKKIQEENHAKLHVQKNKQEIKHQVKNVNQQEAPQVKQQAQRLPNQGTNQRNFPQNYPATSPRQTPEQLNRQPARNIAPNTPIQKPTWGHHQAMTPGRQEDRHGQHRGQNYSPRKIVLERLSHCLEHPEKRFYIMSEMVPRRP